MLARCSVNARKAALLLAVAALAWTLGAARAFGGLPHRADPSVAGALLVLQLGVAGAHAVGAAQ